MRSIEPLVVLLVLPVLIGIVAEFACRDARRASLVAALGTAIAVAVSVRAGVAGATVNSAAAFLVLPLPVAIALATVQLRHGRKRWGRHWNHGGRA